MTNKTVCIIVPAAKAGLARAVAAAMGETGMFTAELYYTGQAIKNGVTGPVAPANSLVAYISSGPIVDTFVDKWLAGAVAVIPAAIAGGWSGITQDITDLFNDFYFDCSLDDPNVVMSRCGVSNINPNA